LKIRAFEPSDYVAARALWERTEGVGLSSADEPHALLKRSLEALRREGIEKCHLLVFRTNEAGLAFWRKVGAEERRTLTLFSIMTTTSTSNSGGNGEA
jgi:hypothetical protein